MHRPTWVHRLLPSEVRIPVTIVALWFGLLLVLEVAPLFLRIPIGYLALFFPGFLLVRTIAPNRDFTATLGMTVIATLVVTSAVGAFLVYAGLFSPTKMELLLGGLSVACATSLATREIAIVPMGWRPVDYRFALFGVVSLVAWIVQIWPSIQYSVFHGAWYPGNIYYPSYYLLTRHEFLAVGNVPTPTRFSQTIYTYIKSIFGITFRTTLFAIVNATTPREILTLETYVPVFKVVGVPIVSLTFSERVAALADRKLDFYQKLFIYTFAIFASYKLLLSGAFQSILLVGTFYFAIGTSKVDRLATIVTAIALIFFYHTVAIVLSFFLMGIFCVQLVSREKILSNVSIVIFIIVLVTNYTIFSEELFQAYVYTALAALSTIGLNAGTSGGGRAVFSPTIPFLASYANVGLQALFFVLFAVVTFVKLYRTRHLNHAEWLAIGLGIGLGGFLGLMLFWRGVKGATRINLYAVIPFFVILPLVMPDGDSLAQLRPNYRTVQLLFSTLIILTSIIAYVPGTTSGLNQLSEDEAHAIEWYHTSPQVEDDAFLFSDFRVATALIQYDDMRTVGVTGHESNASVLIREVYRGHNAAKAARVVRSYDGDYVLVSRTMERYGIVTLPDAYEPMSQDAWNMYEQSPRFELVHESGGARIYRVTRPENGTANG